MESYLFHLMPYPEYSADFDQYESSWLEYPNEHFDPAVGTKLYNEYLDQLVLGEELGFDGVCVNEHHQNAYGMIPSPNVMAALIARQTSRVKIGLIGNAIGMRDHPIRVAEEVALLDVVTGGRIISGFVRGIGVEYHSFQLDPTRSRERFLEAHDLILKAWTTRKPFEWNSKNYKLRNVNVWPRPVQQPHPPIWAPGAGSPETLRWVAENRYTFMSVYVPRKHSVGWLNQIRELCHEFGYEADPGQLGMIFPIVVGESEQEAHEIAEEHLMFLLHKGIKHKFEWLFPPGIVSAGGLKAAIGSAEKPYTELTYADVLDQQSAIIGTADQVVEQLHDLHRETGFGVLCALLQIGSMPHDVTVRNMRRFAAGVLPHLPGKTAAAAA